MCGPRAFEDSKFDSRSFGFPFDRELTFPLSEVHNYRQGILHKKDPLIIKVLFSFVGIRPLKLQMLEVK